jgi:hypothetical protein
VRSILWGIECMAPIVARSGIGGKSTGGFRTREKAWYNLARWEVGVTWFGR